MKLQDVTKEDKMSKMEGHNVVLGIVDEVQYFQPELPIGEVTMAEHAKQTGHHPMETTIPKGWFCYHFDQAANEACTAQWPPAKPWEVKMEKAMLDVMRTGEATVAMPSHYEMEISFPILPASRSIIEGLTGTP